MSHMHLARAPSRLAASAVVAVLIGLAVSHATSRADDPPPPAAPASAPPPPPAEKAALPAPVRFAPGVAVRRDVVYGRGSGRDLHMDVYAPERPRPTAPFVLWIHGGGWVGGSRSPCGTLGLVAKGYVTASVEYRFSQEAPFPAQIEDCKAAVRFVRAHARELGIDPARIGAAGASAGGHLAALLGVAGDANALDGAGGSPGVSSAVQAVCDYFGPTDLLHFDGHGSRIVAADDASLIAQLLGGPLSTHRDLAAAASPITYVTKDDPPILILHGDADDIVPLDQSVTFDARLREAGVDSTLVVVRGVGHGALGAAADAKAVDFFERKLRLRRSTPPPADPPPAAAPTKVSPSATPAMDEGR